MNYNKPDIFNASSNKYHRCNLCFTVKLQNLKTFRTPDTYLAHIKAHHPEWLSYCFPVEYESIKHTEDRNRKMSIIITHLDTFDDESIDACIAYFDKMQVSEEPDPDIPPRRGRPGRKSSIMPPHDLVVEELAGKPRA
jgi:hypothetical protein